MYLKVIVSDGFQVKMCIRDRLGYLEQSGQWELVAAAYNLMAIVSVGKGNLSFAIEYYLAGLKYCKKYELIEVESRIESNLGSLYMECGQYSDARDYLEQAHLCLLYTSRCV